MLFGNKYIIAIKSKMGCLPTKNSGKSRYLQQRIVVKDQGTQTVVDSTIFEKASKTILLPEIEINKDTDKIMKPSKHKDQKANSTKPAKPKSKGNSSAASYRHNYGIGQHAYGRDFGCP